MLARLPFRQRFALFLLIYTLLVLTIWFGYYTITHDAISESERANTILITENMMRQISADFMQMNTAATAIAASDYVSDFLREKETVAFYEKAGTVSEIVRRVTYMIDGIDSVVSISDAGKAYRFSGSLSNNSLEKLYEEFKSMGSVSTAIRLDGTYYFCMSVPVIDYSGARTIYLGNILILLSLDRTGRMLVSDDGADRMLIVDDVVLLSGNAELEGMSVGDVSDKYGAFVSVPVTGTALSVAAAIPEDMLFSDSVLFLVIALITLAIMLTFIIVLYRSLSGYVLQPMAKVIDAAEISKQNMRLGLLATQIDAHFIVNTLKNIKHLSDVGDSSQASQMADGLAAILQHQHSGDAQVNVFDEFIILEKYIAIMNMKYGGKFDVELDVDDSLEACLMPGFILQPIVENALTHGLQNKESDARLVIRGYVRDEDSVVFEISDNGCGIAPDKLTLLKSKLSDMSAQDFPKPGLRGVALINVQRRIGIQCGELYGISLYSRLNVGTTVSVYLPLVRDERNLK